MLLCCNFDFMLPRVSPSSRHVQGGVTEEQMLKYMGANTSLSVLQAKELLEVNAVPPINALKLSLFHLIYSVTLKPD